jgi:hypothetical protein
MQRSELPKIIIKKIANHINQAKGLEYFNKWPISVTSGMGTSTTRCLDIRIYNILPKRNLTRCGVLEYDYLLQFSPSSVFGQEA